MGVGEVLLSVWWYVSVMWRGAEAVLVVVDCCRVGVLVGTL